jgi:hypothetical protein
MTRWMGREEEPPEEGVEVQEICRGEGGEEHQ